MLKNHVLLCGTLLLTIAGFFSRFIGFFYRIFLSRTIGAEGIGLYHLIFPLYATAITMSSSGIATSISRIVSSKTAVHDQNGACDSVLCGLSLSLFMSFCISTLLFVFCSPISVYYIKEPRTAAFIRLISWSIPFAAIHACIEGYYFGLKNTVIPASCQIFSNLIRIGFLGLAFFRHQTLGITISPNFAIYNIILEEIASALFSITALSIHTFRLKISFKYHKHLKTAISEITTMAFPLSMNKSLVTILQSIENLLIPIQLQAYGCTSSKALELYGILNGMVMPLILFPTALSFSLSTILLPVIAEAKIKKNEGYLKRTIVKAVFSCLVLGLFFWLVFFFFGNSIAILLFHNEIAGTFTRTMSWICPLLYLTPALNAILNGLGHTKQLFFHNMTGLLMRITFIILFVPKYGISGVFWGILSNQLTCFLLAIFHFYRHSVFQ